MSLVVWLLIAWVVLAVVGGLLLGKFIEAGKGERR
jgi:uncharacterized protein YneF (UPF0154 family)